MSQRTTHARLAPPRGGVRSWWGRAWLRAVEESAFGETDLRRGRMLARRGDVGGITVDAGLLLAAVRDGDDTWTVQVALPVLDPASRAGFLDAVAAEAGRLPALLAGDLPLDLAEHAEEAGAELVPYAGELGAACSCDAVLDPCEHALALLLQAGWLVAADPLVLLAVRGLGRDDLVAELHRRAAGPVGGADALADDVEVAADAVLRAQRLLALVDAGQDLPDELV